MLPAWILAHSGAPSVLPSKSVACLITKENFELAQSYNAMCRDKFVQQDVDFFLQRLGIVYSDFTLNLASNHLASLNHEHYSPDEHVITFSKATLAAMIAVVDTENAEWKRLADRRCYYTRLFFLDSPPFSDAEYEVVVLNPVQGDICLPPAKARVPAKLLNPFLVALNADIAFRFFRRNPLCQECTELMDLTMQLVEKIFFKPLIDAIEKELLRLLNDRLASAKARRMRTVGRPGPGASDKDIIDFARFLVSDRDHNDLGISGNEDLLAELGSQSCSSEDEDEDGSDDGPPGTSGSDLAFRPIVDVGARALYWQGTILYFCGSSLARLTSLR